MIRTLALLAALALALGCVSFEPEPVDALIEAHTALEETTPLGGDSLAQRRDEFERARHDLAHFVTTRRALKHRRERSGTILFQEFVDGYLGTHLEPLLAGEWPSEHPELLELDATLRLLQAELFQQMRDPRRMQRVVDEIRRRYAGREDLLVGYPIGRRQPLFEALEQLGEQKWRG